MCNNKTQQKVGQKGQVTIATNKTTKDRTVSSSVEDREDWYEISIVTTGRSRHCHGRLDEGRGRHLNEEVNF